MTRALVDSRLITGGQARDLYPSLATLQADNAGRNAVGDTKPGAWADVPGMVNVRARMAPNTAGAGGGRRGEIERPDGTMTRRAERVALMGYFPTITTRHRVLVDGVAFDVLNVDHDGAHASTYLDVERVS